MYILTWFYSNENKKKKKNKKIKKKIQKTDPIYTKKNIYSIYFNFFTLDTPFENEGYV